MRIYITDKNGHELSFSSLKMKEWNDKDLAELLKEVATMLESDVVKDDRIF